MEATTSQFISEVTHKVASTYTGQFYEYGLSIGLPDLVAAIIIGIIVTIAREAYYAHDAENKFTTGFRQTFCMMPVGVAGALMGSEIAVLAGGEQYTWLFTIAIAWIGGESLEKFSQAVTGIMDKALGAIGVRQDKDIEESAKDRDRQTQARRKIEDEELKQYMEKLEEGATEEIKD